jgi:hypothetical protein
MATFYGSTPITDPDQLAYTVNPASYVAGLEEILINTSAKTIALKIVGNLTTDGATIKAVYSKLKDAWRADSTLIKYPFPMGPITDEQFEMVNGWNWDKTGSTGITITSASWATNVVTFNTTAVHGLTSGDMVTIAGVTPAAYNGTYGITVSDTDTFTATLMTNPGTYTSGGTVSNFLKTPDLLRTGGWSVVNTSGAVTEQWAGIITLGTFAANTDQAYIQQAATGAAATAVNIKLTNPVNQAVQILDDPNGDGSYADGYDYRSYFKIFVREWQKLYAQSELVDIGVSQLTYQAYRFPLTNSADLKVTHTEVQIDANSDGTPDVGVYANINITYLRHTTDALYTVKGDWVSGTVYAVADVTQSANGHWYKCIDPTTAGDTTEPESDATNWAAYEGERLIGTTWYPFTVIIDGDTTVGSTASGAARATEIYEAVQYYLRQSTDIDADATASVIGKTAPALLKFVGDTLVTSTGVYVDSFNTQDTNAIEFYDAMGVKRTFPYVAALTVFFGENLQNDQYAKYWVFFTNDDAGNNAGADYGTSSAIIVKDKDSIDMTGSVNPAWPTKRTSVSHSFNYDSNVQRGAASAGFDAPITCVGIGLITGQFVRATGTIQRSTANSVTLTASLERNYSQGTTYP